VALARLHDTPCRTARRTESQALPSLSRVTRSATSEYSLGLLGSSPIPPSFVTSRVHLQLRPLPSTGITRLLRYLRASPPPQTAQPDSHESPVDPSVATAGASRVASGPRFLHAVANTPAGLMNLLAQCGDGVTTGNLSGEKRAFSKARVTLGHHGFPESGPAGGPSEPLSWAARFDVESVL
jgi:hypothetical protein